VIFGGDATGFNDLASADTFDVAVTRSLKLRMEYMPDVMENPLFCITSPAATYTTRGNASGEWLTRNQYANPSILVNGEIGMYEDCRFVSSPLLTLWNCGPVTNQTTITAAVEVGDGAPDPDTTAVDSVWYVGQAGATHGISVADSSGFSVGQRVTLHTARPSANAQKATYHGVTWNSPYNVERRIVAIPNGTTLQFDEPITNNYYQTDLGGGVYGYVTYARPVHAAIFILGPDSVVAGVVQSPQTYNPPTFDDRMAIHRFSWDAVMKYQPFYTNRFLVYFFAGPVDENGKVTTI
jgi:hypothetical protein